MSRDYELSEFIKMIMQSRPGELEDKKKDPDLLKGKRDETNIIQRQIVLGLQKRLSELVDNNGNVQEIQVISQCICMNLQIKNHIEDIF
jgi:hypothetical protein